MNEKCESCPFVNLCDGIIQTRVRVVQAINLKEADGIIVDAGLVIMYEKSAEISSAINELIPDLKDDPSIISMHAKRDQLLAEHTEAKVEYARSRTNVIEQMVNVRDHWASLKEGAQGTCHSPKERKRFIIFGQKTISCTSKIGRKNLAGAHIVYQSSQESLDRISQPHS